MGLYEEEDMHAALSVMCHEVVDDDVFEQACMAVLLAFGPKPEKIWTGISTQDGERFKQNATWIADVEAFVVDRFNVPVGRTGDFITAFEIWCSLRKEDAE